MGHRTIAFNMSSCFVKWHEYEIHRNNYLKQEKELLDVILACEDGHQIRAHKLILSAGSLFFRDILTKIKHTEPLLYMHGMKNHDLQKIIEFVYTGEINVAEKNLEHFLDLGKIFKIPGLQSFEDICAPMPDSAGNYVNNKVINQANPDYQIQKKGINKNLPVMECYEEDVKEEENHFFDRLEENDNKNDERHPKIKHKETPLIEHGENDWQDNSARVENHNADENVKENNLPVSIDELLQKRKDMLDKVDGLWECKECRKTFVKKYHLECHVETHLKSDNNICTICYKTLGTSDTLRKHVMLIHSEACHVCSACGKSGMNKQQLKNHMYQAKCRGKCPKT